MGCVATGPGWTAAGDGRAAPGVTASVSTTNRLPMALLLLLGFGGGFREGVRIRANTSRRFSLELGVGDAVGCSVTVN